MWIRRSSMMLGIETKICSNSIGEDNVYTNAIDLTQLTYIDFGVIIGA